MQRIGLKNGRIGDDNEQGQHRTTVKDHSAGKGALKDNNAFKQQ
ncbi:MULTISPECIES: hypothetical protein [Acinetobacter]|nr:MULTISPECIES: hypothetical protein [Acinetobacter]